jgi:hypothetical protein
MGLGVARLLQSNGYRILTNTHGRRHVIHL